jgi:hypothetical protein
MEFSQYLHYFSRREVFTLAIIAAFLALFFSPVISGDGFGYYSVLEAIGKGGSLDFAEQARFNEISGKPIVEFNEGGGKFVSKYAPGPALFSLPVYTFSLILYQSGAFNIADEFFIGEKGAPLINQMGLTFSALIFVVIALVFSLKTAKKFFPDNSWLLILAAFFGTPLLWYATADLAYSHAFEAGLMALLVYAILKKPDPRLQGILVGLLTITRYSNALFALPLLAFYLVKKRSRDAAKLVLFAAPFALFLMVYFAVQFGSPLSSGYEAGFQSVLPIHLLEVLFDLNRGILWWTPLLVLSIAGLFFFQREEKWLLLSFAGLNLWLYSSWISWHGAWGFGNRFFAILFPVAVIGLGSLLSAKPKLKWLIVACAVWTLALFTMFLAATPEFLNVLDLPGLIGYWVGDGRLLELPARFLAKVSFVRAISLF